jgi:hypothetical protein
VSNPARPVPEQETITALEADWPNWQVWTVHRYIGGTLWCARRWDDHKRVLNAESAEELTGYLEDEAGPVPRDPERVRRTQVRTRFMAVLARAILLAVAEVAGIAANKALDASDAFSCLEQAAMSARQTRPRTDIDSRPGTVGHLPSAGRGDAAASC